MSSLVLDHYRGEQTLTTAAEANILQFRQMTNMQERVIPIDGRTSAPVNRRQAIGNDEDPQAITARATIDLVKAVQAISDTTVTQQHQAIVTAINEITSVLKQAHRQTKNDPPLN